MVLCKESSRSTNVLLGIKPLADREGFEPPPRFRRAGFQPTAIDLSATYPFRGGFLRPTCKVFNVSTDITTNRFDIGIRRGYRLAGHPVSYFVLPRTECLSEVEPHSLVDTCLLDRQLAFASLGTRQIVRQSTCLLPIALQRHKTRSCGESNPLPGSPFMWRNHNSKHAVNFLFSGGRRIRTFETFYSLPLSRRAR